MPSCLWKLLRKLCPETLVFPTKPLCDADVLDFFIQMLRQLTQTGLLIVMLYVLRVDIFLKKGRVKRKNMNASKQDALNLFAQIFAVKKSLRLQKVMRQCRAKAEEARTIDPTACFEKIFQCENQARFVSIREEKYSAFYQPDSSQD